MLVVIGARRKNPGDITRQQGKIQKKIKHLRIDEES